MTTVAGIPASGAGPRVRLGGVAGRHRDDTARAARRPGWHPVMSPRALNEPVFWRCSAFRYRRSSARRGRSARQRTARPSRTTAAASGGPGRRSVRGRRPGSGRRRRACGRVCGHPREYAEPRYLRICAISDMNWSDVGHARHRASSIASAMPPSVARSPTPSDCACWSPWRRGALRGRPRRRGSAARSRT